MGPRRRNSPAGAVTKKGRSRMTAIVDPACTLDLSGRYLIIPSGGLHRDPVAVAEDGLSSIIVDGETFALNDVTLLPVTGEFITTATAGLRVRGRA